jgi:hypothetical protein
MTPNSVSRCLTWPQRVLCCMDIIRYGGLMHGLLLRRNTRGLQRNCDCSLIRTTPPSFGLMQVRICTDASQSSLAYLHVVHRGSQSLTCIGPTGCTGLRGDLVTYLSTSKSAYNMSVNWHTIRMWFSSNIRRQAPTMHLK